MSEIVTIDRAGRVVVPKAVREKLGLKGGEKLKLDLVGDRIELEPEVPEAHVEIAEDGLPIIRGVKGKFDAGKAVLEARERATRRVLGEDIE